jgi:hypothetical protein
MKRETFLSDDPTQVLLVDVIVVVVVDEHLDALLALAGCLWRAEADACGRAGRPQAPA